MSYRQDLAGFGEPMDGAWDGFQRINTETKSGGIIGVFRQGSKETKRTVTINYLKPEKMYHVKDMEGKIISMQTGKAFNEKGFEIVIEKLYDGELFEIELQ